MKASHLRIGNYIMSNTVGQIVVDAKFFVKYEIYGQSMLLSNPPKPIFEPISLTEEWLIKFGFEQQGLGSNTKSISLFGNLRELIFSGDYLYMPEGVNEFRTDVDDICVLWNKDVKKQFYVHQLQNLYFALTGEELTIKE